MSRIHLNILMITIIVSAITGMMIQVVTVGEGVMITLLTLIASPFLFNLLMKAPKHDDR